MDNEKTIIGFVAILCLAVGLLGGAVITQNVIQPTGIADYAADFNMVYNNQALIFRDLTEGNYWLICERTFGVEDLGYANLDLGNGLIQRVHKYQIVCPLMQGEV